MRLFLLALVLLGCDPTSGRPGADGPLPGTPDRSRIVDSRRPVAERVPLLDRRTAADARRPDQSKPVCVTGETLFGGHCYRVTGIKYIGYSTARTLCATQSPPAQMVAITSGGENQFVYGLLPALNQVAWIGLTRTGPGSTDFAWDSGEPVTFWNWAAGEPNNETGAEDCGIMWGPHLDNVSFRGLWNDMDCDYAKVDAVICERVP